LLARKLALLFGFNPGVRPFYAACHFDELSRGSVSCLLSASFEKQFHNATTRFLRQNDDHGVRWGDTGRKIFQWQRPVASRVALDLPQWAMRSALYPLILMAIKMASELAAFFLLLIICCA